MNQLLKNGQSRNILSKSSPAVNSVSVKKKSVSSKQNKFHSNFWELGSDVIRVGYNKRLEIPQNKMLLKQELHDRRGKHDNRSVKLTHEVKELIRIHCESLPRRDYVAIEQMTYNTYFNRNFTFIFKLPRTDVCNKCYENENKSVDSPQHY